MTDLFAFLAKDRHTPKLVQVCVFLYDLELVHPFRDGNGRAGRLWQHALLYKHSEIFAHVPIEALLATRQHACHEALSQGDKAGNANPFIVFMLGVMEQSLTEFVAEVRPLRLDANARLDAAAAHFESALFSRKEYLALHKGIAPVTASRDLAVGIQNGRLYASGEKATAQYHFARRKQRS